MLVEKMENPKRRHRLTKAEEEELILRIGELGGKGLGLGCIRAQLRLTDKQFVRLMFPERVAGDRCVEGLR